VELMKGLLCAADVGLVCLRHVQAEGWGLAARDASPSHGRSDRPPAVCFLDLTGYTRLTEERGDEAAAELAARLAGLVRRSAQEHGGTPVKWLGDGVMFYFREPAAAVWLPLRWWRWSGAKVFHPPMSGSTRGRWSSRTVITSAGP
jgi:class 3 adenylate cyclase